MKKTVFKILFTLFLFAMPVNIMAGTLITAPIDSRPISNAYLEKLAVLNGDSFITVDEKYLDMFSGNGTQAHYADSEKIREEIKKAVSANNKEDTTVIINTSSYFTGGLIGSRCSANYADTDKALKDMFKLIDSYTKPTYYVNIAMPRSLPETRGQEIWPDDEKIKGIAAFYNEYNNDENATEYEEVTAAQFLMEYGYEYNKKIELGEDALAPWEKDYIEFVEENYVTKDIYSSYIKNYILPFEKTAEICQNLMRWQRVERIAEIVIGNDDLQLPYSISYFASQNAPWVQCENGSPIKYSFSRTCMTSGENSVLNRMEKTYNKNEAALAMEGKSENINFIFGMDEIPQLIYARSVAQRAGHCADIEIKGLSSGETAEFDVLTADKLVRNAVNFVSSGLEKSREKINIYVYDYSSGNEGDGRKIINNIAYNLKRNVRIGLIELYNNDALQNNNYIFKSIYDGKNGVELKDLYTFSAWNTNANAIGIGIAQSQISILAEEKTKNPGEFLKTQTEILAQHIMEDGIYFANVRQMLSAQGYMPDDEERMDSPKLHEMLNGEKTLSKLIGRKIEINGEKRDISSAVLEKVCFPWGRLFDCQVDIKCRFK